MSDFIPLADHYRLKKTEASGQTSGGILLPETAREQPTEAEVVAAGPGLAIPGTDRRTVMQVEAGDRVIFLKHEWEPLTEDEGTLDDTQLVGLVNDETGEVEPLNDWVKLAAPAREAETKGGLLVPDRWRKRKVSAVVLAVGPGERRKSGPLFGTRKPVADIVNVTESSLIGRTAYWSRHVRSVEVRQPSGAVCLFVRAEGLLAVEE